MENNYAKACKEVSEILRYVSKDDFEKIPQEILNIFEEKMDKNYDFHYDENKEFEEQILLIETKAILANLFRDYWSTAKQREEIKELQSEQRKERELQKREKYNPDNLFKKSNLKNDLENIQLIEIKEESFIQKIINKIKKILKINSKK